MMMTTEAAPTIYKVMPRADFESAAESGLYSGSTVDLSDGYIHFSTGAQLAETLRRHYAGQTDLVVLAVPAAELGEALRWEASRGGALFPHLYGPLPLNLVIDSAPVSVGADGQVDLPPMVR